MSTLTQKPLLLLSLPGNEQMCASLATAMDRAAGVGAEIGVLALRTFPDGETLVRIDSPVRGRDVAVVCTLDRPDDKLLPLLFTAGTASDLGAARVGVVAPYLAYMRQDRRFAPGEGVTSTYFAKLLSAAFDWLVTVDPHLHRRTALGEIYTCRTAVVHAGVRVADWIRRNVERPVLIGPDEESAQWLDAVSAEAGAPAIVLRKVRRGDRDVSVSVPNVDMWRDHTPVLVDDIISTARTMIETVRHVREAGLAAPVCIGVHAVFAPGAYDALREAGAGRVVTCTTIRHESNAIDVTRALAAAVAGITGHKTGPARIAEAQRA